MIEEIINLCRSKNFNISDGYIKFLTENLDGGFHNGDKYYFDFLSADDVMEYNFNENDFFNHDSIFVFGSNGAGEYLVMKKNDEGIYFFPVIGGVSDDETVFLFNNFQEIFE